MSDIKFWTNLEKIGPAKLESKVPINFGRIKFQTTRSCPKLKTSEIQQTSNLINSRLLNFGYLKFDQNYPYFEQKCRTNFVADFSI